MYTLLSIIVILLRNCVKVEI